MSHLPPNYTLSVVSINRRAGKSSLCQRLIDSNLDNYRSFLTNDKSKISSWFYWGSIKHRRLDEKREAIFHLIEHPSLNIDAHEFLDNYLKRISILTLRSEEKHSSQVKSFPKEKIPIDGFLCIYDLSSNKCISDYLILLHTLSKTRRPIIIVTTKNDLISNQSSSSSPFEQTIHHSFPHIPIVHISAHEHVNIPSVLELALYACDESTRKAFHTKYIPPNYLDAYKNEQSLKHVIQTEYRALLSRHVPDLRVGLWEKFYERWQHHTSVQTFIDMFGKDQAKCLYEEHIDELKKSARQKLIEERLIPILDILLMDQKSKISRNWDYVRLQMQKHPRYSSTVIPAARWSDLERNNANQSLIIPDDFLDTLEARLQFEFYLNSRQTEQTRRTNCRAFFELLNRFSNAGLVHYGDSYEKDSVYFLGRECYESLNGQDRLRVFALHQSYLYRLICLQFVELLFESLEIFINTFEKMNVATNKDNEKSSNSRKITTITIDEIFHKEIIQQIKHDSRYQSLNKRETDRHRLMMCHCHFLYDCIYYPSTNINRLLKQRRRSFKRRKSSTISYSNHMTVDENFCPYTRKIVSNDEENDLQSKKNLEIGCPMENQCADIRIVNEILAKSKFKTTQKNLLICGNDTDVDHCLRVFSTNSSDLQINFIALKHLKFQTIDGCVFVSFNAQTVLQDYLSKRRIHLNLDHIPILNLYTQFDVPSVCTIPDEQLRSSFEQLFFAEDFPHRTPKNIHLRILVCFMCGSERNDLEAFFSQLSSRFSLSMINQSSFVINTFLDRSNRKIELIPVSFHSLFAVKLTDFNGFVLLYDGERKAASNTMTYLEKYISTSLHKQFQENETICPPIYILSCVDDPALSNIRKFYRNSPARDYRVQYHSGTMRSFIELHLLPFLNQCYVGKYGKPSESDHDQNEELLANVASYLNRVIHSSTDDLMTSSLEHTRQPLINSMNNNGSKSNEHSPKHHHHLLLTPTNQEQTFTYQSHPHLSNSTNGADSTIVPTTPIDPSIPNLSLISTSSISTSSMSDSQHQYFQKSSSMRFAKLMEHPTNRSSYQPSASNGHSVIQEKLAEVEEMKFRLYKHRTAPHVKVPLATPEIIELNEITTAPFSVQEYFSPLKNNREDQVNSLDSITRNSTVEESIPTKVTDSSVDSSSDERLRTSSTTIQNLVQLQRKPSDRKIKRVRAKQNDAAGSTSSNEVLKKLESDDDDKRTQKKKHRPSLKKRKKTVYDQTQTDSGIDSRMDSKDSNKVIYTPEPSTSVIISNEDDSSVGDGPKDSKNASIEELEERPTANWIRRQLQHFAQARREKSELKSRLSALTTVTSVSSPPLFKATLTSTSPQTVPPFSSLENSHHHVPIRLTLGRCPLSTDSQIPLFIEKCIQFIEEHGLTIEGLYRISGYKNQVELVINKLVENPNIDLNYLKVPASAIATAFKDMMRKLDEPILSLEQFDQCQTLTIEQLREQNFLPIQQALLRTTDLKYRTNKFIFKHLHFVSQHAALTHMDSSNLAVLWWPNLFQPQFHDLRTAEQICQKAKPLIQTIIDNYSMIFIADPMAEKTS